MLPPACDRSSTAACFCRKSLQEASDGEESLGGSEEDGDEDSDAPDAEEQNELESDEDEDEDQLEAFKAKLNGVEAGTNGLG